MNKSNLIPGRKYLRIRHTIIAGIPRTAESWIRCVEITPKGAMFSRDFEPDIELTDKQIAEELQSEK